MLLSELGHRICILGPSNSGKSTLADAVGRKCGLPAIHLDQLYHVPGTNWEQRPAGEFEALHDAAIGGDRWVMDGNYSRCLPQRLQRATGLIVLDVSAVTSVVRYVRRAVFGKGRVGGIAGGRDSVKVGMLRHIAVVTPANRRRYAEIYQAVALPKLLLPCMRAIDKQYEEWQL